MFFKLLSFVLVVNLYFMSVSGKNIKKERHILANHEIMDVTDFSIYYNVKTNQTIKNMMPRPWYSPGWKLRLPFVGGPCDCIDNTCDCCSGVKIDSLNYNRRVCARLTYESDGSTLDMAVSMGGESVYRNKFSARNVPTFCVPIPIPYLSTDLVDMCIRLFDINTMDQKLHVCMDWDTRIAKTPVLILHYDCMDMSLNGVGLSKPGGTNSSGSDTNSIITPAPESTTQADVDVYDPVYEKSTDTTTISPFELTTSYI